MRTRSVATTPSDVPDVFSGIKRVKASGRVVFVEFFGGTYCDVATASPELSDPEGVARYIANVIDTVLHHPEDVSQLLTTWTEHPASEATA